MMKKSQASMEFLTIFGIAFLIILIMAGIFFTYTMGAKDTLDRKQIEKIGEEIMFNAEQVYFLGQGNRVTINTNFPDKITNITIMHRNTSDNTATVDMLNISYVMNKNIISSIFTTSELYIRFNCTLCYVDPSSNTSYYNTSDFSVGPKRIRVTSHGDWVSIDFAKE